MLPWRREEHPAGIDKFRGILVAIGDNPMDEAVVKFACWLTKGTKTPIYAVHVIEMPWTEPVDASPDEDVSMRADKSLGKSPSYCRLHRSSNRSGPVTSQNGRHGYSG